ncbi:MAG: KEOPS complex N(6)-L-threonylcarbamoyladenine synthase Kae1 [Candidatus Micrarchaeia archaeon]|jgi:N6-L-threonylcarbamoyladenine synthase
MITLGIESSAHTLGIGIVEDSKVLADKRASKIGKGIIPREVAKNHEENFLNTLEEALDEARISIKDVDVFAYTKGPGIGRCLYVGALCAITLATELKKPVVGVNHALAHIEITRHFAKAKDPLVLYISGGNSQILIKENKHYRVIGETLDIGLGNLLDSFARELKLKKAWGSELEKIAKKGKYIQMPYTVKGMDFTFTGLLTHAKKLIGKEKTENIAYSLMETSFSMVVEATERALALTGKKILIACGGVAQNKRIQEMLKKMAKEHNAKFYTTKKYNADNGVMIALTGEKMFKTKTKSKIGIKQRYRIEEAEVNW